MAKGNKNLTPKPSSKNRQEYEHQVKLLKGRIAAAKKAGFTFPSIFDIIGEIPARITQKVIQKIKDIRKETLYEKAISFERDDRELPVSEGIISYKDKLRETAIKNLPVRKKPISSDQYINEQTQIGKPLLKEYYQLSQEKRIDFINNLSKEDLVAFTLTKDIFGKEYEETYGRIQRTEPSDGGQTGKIVLPNESPQYHEDYEEDEEEYASEISEQEGTDDSQSRREQIETPYEEIKNSPKAREWKQKFDENKNKHYANREYINQGEAIYYMILDEIEKFEGYYSADSNFRYRHEFHNGRKNSLKALIQNKIAQEGGVDALMRRLQGRGLEVHNALENLLYFESERGKGGKKAGDGLVMEDVVGHAYMQLVDIINGGAFTPEEAKVHTEIAETMDDQTL